MFSPQLKRNFRRIFPFGIIWLFFALVYSLLERGLLGEMGSYPSTGNPYNFSRTIFITAGIAFLLGLIIGTIEVIFGNRIFRKWRFSKKLLLKTVLYVAFIILFLSLNTLIFNSIELHKSIFSAEVWNNYVSFFFNYAFWGVSVYIAAIIVVSLFFKEVSYNLGQGVLNNFLTGKYHTPVEEDRIFMFLDMKSSTTIAEDIGHVSYFEMLRRYFNDISAPILKHCGEIYQYVGDEVVVTWKLKDAKENNNCINCFLAMKRALKKQHKKYEHTFGVAPGFKAGIHCGQVTTGQIGLLKKEIIFTGDVLNTAARIQSLCNSYEVDLIISGQLHATLELDSLPAMKCLGNSELRGKDEEVQLYTME